MEGSEVVRVGDMVRYSTEFLTSIYAIVKPEFNDSGVIVEVDGRNIAKVKWQYGKLSKVRISNLELFRPLKQGESDAQRRYVEQ